MEYSLAKGYISRRRFWQDFGLISILIFGLFVIIAAISNITIDLKQNLQKAVIVRDTIYLKQEVEIKGPDHYHDFINERHPLDLKTSDGWYHVTVIDP